MKATFICGLCGLVSLAGGCVALELPSDGSNDAEDHGCFAPECSMPHGFEGEVIVFANARLTDASSSFQSHIELDEPGTFLGNAIYLYDPNKTCDDGGNACRMVEIGNLLLDERLGAVSVGDLSLRKFVVRDIAWDPELGLWAATFDTFNDEWSISRLEVDDWTATGNLIGVDRWVIPPGAAESPSTDPCYWFESVSGLGFAEGELLIGVRGAGSKGLVTDGSLLSVDLDVLDQGHCVHPFDTSQDPDYYACASLCEPWCSFGPKVGVAGDVIDRLEGEGASAWLRSEDDSVMPISRNELASCSVPEPGEISESVPDDVFDDAVVRGDEIDGLARVGGVLYGLSVLGKVYRIDEVERTLELVDDLGPLFPEQGLRLRGATTVVIPAADGT
ncbi:hypothetical protein ACNOYE_15455 [Nannocystaceae bacterium ST9]